MHWEHCSPPLNKYLLLILIIFSPQFTCADASLKNVFCCFSLFFFICCSHYKLTPLPPATHTLSLPLHWLGRLALSCHRSRGLAKLAKRLFSLVVVVAVAVEWKTRFIAYFDKSGTHIKSEHKKNKNTQQKLKKSKKEKSFNFACSFFFASLHSKVAHNRHCYR